MEQELSTYDKLIIHMLNGERIEYNMNEVRNVTFGKAVVDEPLFKEHAVDLGLSVLWSDIFVGEEKEGGKPEEYSFGALEPGKGHEFDLDHILVNKENPSICGTARDIAHVKYGGRWRMPTYLEMKELFDKCSFEYNKDDCSVTIIGPSYNSIKLHLSKGFYNGENSGDYVKFVSGELDSDSICQYMTVNHYDTYNKNKVDFLKKYLPTSLRRDLFYVLPVLPKE